MGTLVQKYAGHEISLIDDDRVCQKIIKDGNFEPLTLALWTNLCRPGCVVLDVGGYNGLFSLIATKRGARAICIEPMEENRIRINANMMLNGVQFELIEAAASDSLGEVSLHFNPSVYMTAGASLVHKPLSNVSTRKVQAITIDSLGLARLDAIKVDVERAELKVLQGAIETIRKHRPTMIIEALTDTQRQHVTRLLPEFICEQIIDVRNMVMRPQ